NDSYRRGQRFRRQSIRKKANGWAARTGQRSRRGVGLAPPGAFDGLFGLLAGVRFWLVGGCFGFWRWFGDGDGSWRMDNDLRRGMGADAGGRVQRQVVLRRGGQGFRLPLVVRGGGFLEDDDAQRRDGQ